MGSLLEGAPELWAREEGVKMAYRQEGKAIMRGCDRL